MVSKTLKIEQDVESQVLAFNSSSNIRIARVITRMNVGGPSTHVALAQKYMAPLGFKTTVLAGNLALGECEARNVIEHMLEPPVLLPSLQKQGSVFRDVQAFYRLVRIFRKLRPHIVHTHMSKAGALGRLAAWVARVPVRVHTYHGLVFSQHFSSNRSRLYVLVERILSSVTQRLVAISPRQKETLTHLRIADAKRIECIPLGLELERYAKTRDHALKLRQQLGIVESVPLIGWIGRLVDIKDPLLFVSVAKRISQLMPHCHFVMIGDGELRLATERAILDSSLSGRMHLTGWKHNMEDIYSDLELVILTSKNEGTPLVLIESMASGTPFIAPSVGGIPDLVLGHPQHINTAQYFKNAVLVDRYPESFAAAAQRLISNECLRSEMGRAAQQFVLQNFSANRLANDLASLYRTLLRENQLYSC